MYTVYTTSLRAFLRFVNRCSLAIQTLYCSSRVFGTETLKLHLTYISREYTLEYALQGMRL